MLSVIPENSLEVIDAEANKDHIEWEKAGKEFYLYGQLYDVAKIKKTNGKNLLYCVNDKKEEQLLKDLSKTVRSGNDQTTDNKDSKHTVKFQLTDFILREKTAFIKQAVPQKYLGFNINLVVSCIKEVSAPPPRA